MLPERQNPGHTNLKITHLCLYSFRIRFSGLLVNQTEVIKVRGTKNRILKSSGNNIHLVSREKLSDRCIPSTHERLAKNRMTIKDYSKPLPERDSSV